MLNFTFLGRELEVVKVQPLDYVEWHSRVYSLMRNKYQYSEREIDQMIEELDEGEGVALHSLYCEGKTPSETARLLVPHY